MELFKLEKPLLTVFLERLNIKLSVLPPLKKHFYMLKFAETDIEYRKITHAVLNRNKEKKSVRLKDILALPSSDIADFINSVYDFEKRILELPELAIPYYDNGDEKPKFQRLTAADKLVADYINAPIDKAQELDIMDYQLILREAVIYLNSGSEKGLEYLEDCYYFMQTEPDREGLRKIAGKAGRVNKI